LGTFARRVGLLGLLVANACGPDSASLAKQLAAADAELSQRLAPAPGTWQRDGERWTSPGFRSAQLGPFYDIGATLPALADGPLEIGVGQSPELTARWTPERARPVGVEDDRGRAVYRGAFPSTDLIFVAGRARIEWFLLLHDSAAPREFTWRITLPAGLPGIRSERSGAWVFTDRAGTARLRIPRAEAIDARGIHRPATLRVVDRRLVVGIDTRGLTFPVLLDPAVESSLWIQRAADNLGRSSHALAYDSVRGRTVLFGGGNGADVLGDTWEWDGTAWVERSPPSSAPARSGHAMTFDSARGVTVLFGGWNGANIRDTWTWDGTTWSEVPGTVGPSPRQRHSMAFDSRRGKTVLFGGAGTQGVSDTGALGDLWEFDGTTWTQRLPATSPIARVGAAIAFDEVRGQTVLFGGLDLAFNQLDDTWEWDGTSWANRTPATSPPPFSTRSMVYDTARNRVVYLASDGSTWQWDGTSWQMRSPASTTLARFEPAMAYDRAHARAVLFGGAMTTNLLGDTWTWDGSTWSQAAGQIAPFARFGAALAYDTSRRRAVLFAGGPGGSANQADTWEWDGSAWAQRLPATSPPGRQLHAMVYDGARGTTVLFGGGDDPLSPSTFFADTWQWDGTNWTQLAPTTSPPGRFKHAMCFDSGRSKIVLFGGEVYTPLDDTWEWDGANWTQAMPTTKPPARDSHALAYDAARGVSVLFGGDLSRFGSPVADTWTWNGTQWTQQNPVVSPSARGGHAMAYDSARARLILFGGRALFWPTDTWEWDGTYWTPQSPATGGPPGRDGAAMTFDPDRGDILMFGGESSLVLNDTWTYHTRGGPCTSGAQCDRGACVDGVCCDRTSCDTCQDCNGSSPGTCTLVAADAIDPDSCVAPNVCGPTGACGAPNGTACAFGATCSTGFCVGGVCCNTLCNGPCDTCLAAKGAPADGVCFTPSLCTAGKNLGDKCAVEGECVSQHCVDGVCCNNACNGVCVACNGTTGICENAADSSDPHGSCKGDASCGGTCNGSGACRYPSSGTHCDTCKACDGNGKCNQLPANEDDPACGPISCAGLATECATFADVSARRCVVAGLCAAPNDPTTCTTMTPVADGTVCSTGTCSNGQCVAAQQPGGASGKGGGCALASPGPASPGALWLVALFLLVLRRARRRHPSI
jgi:MYXO-CTERM domain-containing protein